MNPSSPERPSLTTWNRLEPRPVSTESDVRRALAAEVRDPLWLLARQWQFGEFSGEDGGSIAWASVTTEVLRDRFWGKAGMKGPMPYALLDDHDLPARPIEAELEREEFSDPNDLTLAVELGQLLEDCLASLLDESGILSLSALRAYYPITSQTAAMEEETRRFADFCRGRVCNGYRAFDDLRHGNFSGRPLPEPGRLRAALDLFRERASRIWGDDRTAQQGTWEPDSLRHRGQVVAGGRARESTIRMSVSPGISGEIDWYSFDTSGRPQDAGGVASTRYMTPGHVRFRGMPNARFWDFESAESDMGAVTPDIRELGKLLFMDFMLIQGNDWFVLPMPMEVGAICRIPRMSLRTVFGEDVSVPGVETRHAGWSMFGTTRTETTQVRDTARPDCGPVVSEGLDIFLHLPASASRATQEAPAIEAVRFQRDEVANIAWAVERLTPDQLGRPRSGRERDIARPSPVRAVQETGGPPTQYELQDAPPSWWFPLVPVTDSTSTGQVALELGSLFDGGSGPSPQGRILGQMGRRSASIRIREEEVPKVGVELRRGYQMTRWVDGSVHVWCQRARRVGISEGSSGLRFDRLEPRRRE